MCSALLGAPVITPQTVSFHRVSTSSDFVAMPNPASSSFIWRGVHVTIPVASTRGPVENTSGQVVKKALTMHLETILAVQMVVVEVV